MILKYYSFFKPLKRKLEEDLFNKVPELNEKLESILSQKIRNLIKKNALPSEVEALIAEVLPALNEIEKVLMHK